MINNKVEHLNGNNLLGDNYYGFRFVGFTANVITHKLGEALDEERRLKYIKGL